MGEGTYDETGFVRVFRELQFSGPFGFQGYCIKGETRDIPEATINVWRETGEK
ncbi:hypothetical protein JW935_15225 [candidate division KSB1 bacterium]|nr:hypothetical protein [candidate division KSB1 bacterium]